MRIFHHAGAEPRRSKPERRRPNDTEFESVPFV